MFPLHHIGYWVENLDRARRQWQADLGVGPFATIEQVPFDSLVVNDVIGGNARAARGAALVPGRGPDGVRRQRMSHREMSPRSAAAVVQRHRGAPCPRAWMSARGCWASQLPGCQPPACGKGTRSRCRSRTPACRRRDQVPLPLAPP